MPLSLLQDLVRLPSVNPMGRELEAAICYEHRVTRYLTEFFQQLGVRYEVRELAPGRSNVIARLDGPADAPLIMFDAHQDTVPIDGMTIDPFAAEVRGEGEEARIQGRGACDVKGGLAAMLDAFARLARSATPPARSLVMACTCDEEFGQLGAGDLRRSWTGEAPPYDLVPRPPDLVVVAEPTDLHVVVAHRGALRWRVRTLGKAAHSSDPSQGENAIYRMAEVVVRLREYARVLGETIPADPWCGPATMSVGVIRGGSSVNIVPDECVIEIDRRLLPGETSAEAFEDCRRFLAGHFGEQVRVEDPLTGCHPLAAEPQNTAWGEELLRHVRRRRPDRRLAGVAYGTHAAGYARHGAPSLVFGPGSILQAHTKDEWLAVEELRQAADILWEFARG